jgi:hypothetical protein
MQDRLTETVTLSQARELVMSLAHQESLLLLSPPGVGKSEMVAQAAISAGLKCRSLLGTQIAPEDVSGVPKIVGERSVFCPPRVLLPETPEPFCLFLDELPACTPDIQKAFYSLLLERRVGEHHLPPGTWVVAAGNRTEDRALVRTISSALINRVILLHVRVDLVEWIAWAEANSVRKEIISYLRDYPGSLLREVPSQPVPFSTPRAWTLLSEALDLAEAAGILDMQLCTALSAGRVSAEDVLPFCNWWRLNSTIKQGISRVGLAALLNRSVRELDLSLRCINVLEVAGLSIVRDLVVRSEKDLREHCHGMDNGHMTEIKLRLTERGLWLGMELV